MFFLLTSSTRSASSSLSSSSILLEVDSGLQLPVFEASLGASKFRLLSRSSVAPSSCLGVGGDRIKAFGEDRLLADERATADELM